MKSNSNQYEERQLQPIFDECLLQSINTDQSLSSHLSFSFIWLSILLKNDIESTYVNTMYRLFMFVSNEIQFSYPKKQKFPIRFYARSSSLTSLFFGLKKKIRIFFVVLQCANDRFRSRYKVFKVNKFNCSILAF